MFIKPSAVLSYNQMAAVTSQWWRRLVNTYEVKAGMVCVKTVWSIPEHFRGELLWWVLYKSMYL